MSGRILDEGLSNRLLKSSRLQRKRVLVLCHVARGIYRDNKD